MIKFAPLVLGLAYGIAVWYFSVWRTRRMLETQSTQLTDLELRHVARRLARALDLPDIPVRIFEVEPVNGLADVDGRIYLTRGFVRSYQAGEVTAEEMASVIAHELGHVALGHTRRRMIDFAGKNAVFVSVIALILRAIPVVGPFIALALANVLTSALEARLSRRDEYEADAWASALMIKAGIGTGPQKALFQKLGRLTGQAMAGAPAWLLSHPSTADRIRAIEDNESRWTSGLPKP